MIQALAATATGALSHRATRQALIQFGHRDRWDRTNFHGRTVNLSGGVITAGALTMANAATCLVMRDRYVRRVTQMATLNAAVSGVFGYIDDMDQGDHDGNKPAKGFAGHVGALKEGRLTTGMLKILGIGTTALISSCVIANSDKSTSPLYRLAKTVTSTGLIAGSANMANLFDLRPGRLHKTVLMTAAALAPGSATPQALAKQIESGIAAGVAIAGMPTELREDTMNGDTGANALGATIGTALTSLSLPAQVAALAVIVGLTAVSEKVSFTEVIEQTPLLAFIDNLGRRAQ